MAAVSLPGEINYQPSWLSWVGATTTCLNYLGVECDMVGVAGYTSYAFVMCIHDELCPSGPTMFDWGILELGVNLVGRTTVVYQTHDCHFSLTESGSGTRSERTRAHCRRANELVRRELEAGRPCVLWGAYVPEFAVAVGMDAEGRYLVKSIRGHCGADEPPVACDQLEAPGGMYVMAFPDETGCELVKHHRDHWALGQALKQLFGRPTQPQYAFGLAAYERWINALESGSADPQGNAYNAQCWAEARRLAAAFLIRISERDEQIGDSLRCYAMQYTAVAEALVEVAQLFPFPPPEAELDAGAVEQAITQLRHAAQVEAEAAAGIDKVWQSLKG